MKCLYLLCALLLLGLLQGPGVAQAIETHDECESRSYTGCYSLLCPRGTKTIGSCSWYQKCCQSLLTK